MLKLYIFLYKLTGYCPAWLELRTYKYALRRLKRLSIPGYYIGQPVDALDFWITDYQAKIGLYRAPLKKQIRYFLNKLEEKWNNLMQNS